MGAGGYKPIGSASDVQMINPQQYGNALNQTLGSIGQYGTQFSGAQGQASSLLGQMSGLSDNYNNLIAQLTGGYGQQGLAAKLGQVSEQYDPSAGLNLFLSQQPQLQGVAEGMAKNALSEYGQSAQELARETSRQSLSDTASQLAQAGVLGSGAGTAAMTRAALAPQLEATTNLAQARSNYLANVGGQLASQGLGQAQSAYDTQQQMAMQGILGQMQGVGQAGSLLGQQISGLGAGAQGYAQLGSSLASLLGNAQSTYAGLSQPEYWQPQYEAGTSGADWLGAAAPIVGSVLGSLIAPGAGTAIGGGLGSLIAGLFGGGGSSSGGGGTNTLTNG